MLLQLSLVVLIAVICFVTTTTVVRGGALQKWVATTALLF